MPRVLIVRSSSDAAARAAARLGEGYYLSKVRESESGVWRNEKMTTTAFVNSFNFDVTDPDEFLSLLQATYTNRVLIFFLDTIEPCRCSMRMYPPCANCGHERESLHECVCSLTLCVSCVEHQRS